MELKTLSRNIKLPGFVNNLYDGLNHTSEIKSYSNLKASSVIYYVDSKYPYRKELAELVRNGNEEICNEVEKIWKRKFKSKVKEYVFNIDQALDRLCYEIAKYPFENLKSKEWDHPSYKETRERVIRTALKEYINVVGKEKAYETLSQGRYGYDDNYILDNPLKLIKNDYKTAKDVNKEQYSKIVSSTFIAYYYYEDTIKVGDEEITFLDTCSTVCCG